MMQILDKFAELEPSQVCLTLELSQIRKVCLIDGNLENSTSLPDEKSGLDEKPILANFAAGQHMPR